MVNEKPTSTRATTDGRRRRVEEGGVAMRVRNGMVSCGIIVQRDETA